MKIKIGNNEYSVILNDNDTVKTLQSMLPLSLKMVELNGNEKYYYLNKPLPSNPQHIRRVNSGDIMLFGNDCLVIFYKNFTTSYSYTYIGHIKDDSTLEKVLGNGNVVVTFE